MEHYALALVRAAVIAGLPSLQIKFDEATKFKNHDTLSFFFPKLNLSTDQLKQLTPKHDGGRHHPSLKDLGLALQSARLVGEVKVTSFEKKISYNLTVGSESDSLTKRAIKVPEQIGLEFTVQGEKLEEPSDLLRKRCRWAPLTWSINPKRLTHKLTKKDFAKDCKVVLHRKGLELTGRLAKIQHQLVLRDPKLLPGLNYLAWRPESEHDSRLLGLKNGVTYPLEIPELPKQVFCLLDCHELGLDPQGNGFVEGEALDDKLNIVKKAFEQVRSSGNS